MQIKRYSFPSLKEGFSLVELLVALVILGLLAGIGVPLLWGLVESKKKETTEANLKLIGNVLDYYKLQMGNYPKQLEYLIEKPKGDEGKKWTDPFLKGKKLPVDGWSKPFYYKLTPGGKHAYELYSYGKKGPDEATPEEHISVWEL